MIPARPIFVFGFLLALNFSIASYLQPHFDGIVGHAQGGDAIEMALGDARRLFANHFFVKADVYFHRGYYPSFVQQGYQNNAGEIHIKEHGEEPGGEHEDGGFMGPPKNWIDKFGRNFFPSHHNHRDGRGEAKEILPWLKLSAELDPQRIDIYTTASYWLCSNMGKFKEAEDFLRIGLRANPDSYEILFELGTIHKQYLQEPDIARNLWELALRRWLEQDEAGKDPDIIQYDRIVANLASLEEGQGNLYAALDYLKAQVNVTPQPEGVSNHITELEAKLARPEKR